MSSEIVNKSLNEEEKLPPECYQEDALYYDDYQEEDEKGPCKTHEQKLQRLEQLDNQRCCPYKLREVYPNIEVITREELEEQAKRIKQFKEQMGDEGYDKLDKPLNDTEKQEEENKDKFK
ncbi:uncharacterized protein LOC112467217 [Temnothorax curvispinosus]|uniref:Uncharacterized protein LOC112467217 n=1 Tax=Temnothorax curvispinosus TaxID=300111 RepID=A0A6J1RB84_9HYME|nr:uncharacterized protein LOC112467217 [Temnothorax curvispinosus]